MKPSAARVLARLRQGPASTHDLCQPDVGGIRFGGRIEELRNDEGYVISREYLRPGSHLYRLLAEPSTTSLALPPAGEPPAPIPPLARATLSKPAGITGSSGQAQTGGVIAIPERNVAVEKPRPSVCLPDALFDPEPFTQRPGMEWAAA